MTTCERCGFYDHDYCACTCPSTDLWYACPLEPEPDWEEILKENNEEDKDL